MILIFGSSLFEDDPQNNLLRKILDLTTKKYVFINPLNTSDLLRIELKQSGKRTFFLVDGLAVNVDTVYMSRLWRIDCLIDIPQSCTHPTLFRHKVESFLNEIRFSFDHVRWLPGKYEDVEKAEAKIPLMQIASRCGLLTPKVSLNSFGSKCNDGYYKKSLGNPFTISFDTETRDEVAVTLINKLEPSSDEQKLGIPWQWQTHIEPTSQIRCVLINNKIRAYKADIAQFKNESLREAQEDGTIITWEKYTLPVEIQSSLLKLTKQLGLTLCCPEFLVTSEGAHFFIDLNPSGDWYGFLNEEENVVIARLIVEML